MFNAEDELGWIAQELFVVFAIIIYNLIWTDLDKYSVQHGNLLNCVSRKYVVAVDRKAHVGIWSFFRYGVHGVFDFAVGTKPVVWPNARARHLLGSSFEAPQN
jgi:hypothetical protein